MINKNKKLGFLQPLKNLGNKAESKQKPHSSKNLDSSDFDTSIEFFDDSGQVSKKSTTTYSLYNCLCCGTSNKIQSSYQIYKCSHCKMKNLLPSKSTTKAPYPSADAISNILSLKEIQSQFSLFQKQGYVTENLDSDIKTAFSSTAALNNSFLVPQSLPSKILYAIDWESLRAYYKVILLFPSNVKKAMMSGIESALLNPNIYPEIL
ncbi:hypothetical protein BB561_002753 [Smittium simulii]|uniref:Uncharacterized protein n=1 Tax=Smittium simulii TaxID=133385 RepID=A0A2T9YPE3_9FUNG|nr:hypothetical protein BB561_002753 [Smittium simulii]